MNLNEADLAARTKRLPEMFADRVPGTDLEGLRSMAAGGEWDQLLDLLVAALQVTGAAISAEEHDLLRELLTGWGIATEQLDNLVVRR
ncbi:MAG: hypothetical protein J2P27_05220 [Actinobacteria bacterium]|nr:hypothetical protein [Actinomycetota bacterium]